MSDLNGITTRRIVVVTARRQYAIIVTSADEYTASVRDDAGSVDVHGSIPFIAATIYRRVDRLDRVAIQQARAEQWARAGLKHCQPYTPDDLPSAPIAIEAVAAFRFAVLSNANLTAAQQMQVQMCAEEGVIDYREAWQRKMDRWLAKTGDPVSRPMIQPRRFSTPNTLSA
jgi:hypothetical protein